MRRVTILAAVVLLLAGAAWWWRSHAAPAEPPSSQEADEQARARLERLRAQLAAASSAPLPPPQGDLEIGGRVIGRNGPVAGATVTATTPDPGESLPALLCDSEPSSKRPLLDATCVEAVQLATLVAERRGDAQPMARATTDATGRFTLRGLAAGAYALWAEAPEGAGMNKGVAAGSNTDVLLGEGMRIHGKVVDGQQHPVEAAVVTAIFPDPTRFFDTLSAADGSFSLGPLPRATYVVIAQSGTLLPDRASSPEGSRPSLLLTLHGPRHLRGRVLQGESPAPGASVTLYQGQRRQTAVTDEAGAFHFGPLRAGSGLLIARQGNLRAETTVLIPERMDPPDAVLHLELGGRVECSVVDAAGAPVPHATASLNVEEPGGRDIPVAADGTCRAEGVASGTYSLTGFAKGFQQKDSRLLNIHPGETVTERVVLEPVEMLEGTVLDPAGRPLAGASVWYPDLTSYDPGRTGADGRFSLEYPRSESATLEASHDDYAPSTVTVKLPAPGLVIQLAPGPGVDGVVLDAAGVPVEGSQVRVCEGRVSAETWGEIGCQALRLGVTDVTGAFHFRALPKGPLTLAAIRDMVGFSGQEVLKVLDRVPSDRVTLQFPPAGRIAGIAVDEAGHPLGDVRVGVRSRQAGADGSALVAERDSDEAGAFEVQALDVGEYQLTGWLQGYRSAEARAHTGDGAVKLVLRPSAMVRGRVVTPSGEPVPVFRVDWLPFEDPDGRFAIERNDASEMTVTVEAGADLAATIRQVPPGESDYALGDIVVSAGRRIAGRVLDAETGLGIPGAMVASGSDPDQGWHSPFMRRNAATARPDGSFELPHVEDRSESLIAWRDGYEQAAVQVKNETEIDIRLHRMGRITGEVQWNGQRSLRVLARGADTEGSGAAVTDVSGHFAIDDLPAGSYSVEVLGPPDDVAFSPVVVQVPRSREARVTIVGQAPGGTLRLRVRGVSPGEQLKGILVKSLVKLPVNLEELQAAVSGGAVGAETDGVLVFEKVPRGEYVALVVLPNLKPPRYRLAMMPVVIGAEDQSIDLTVPAGAPTIEVRAP